MMYNDVFPSPSSQEFHEQEPAFVDNPVISGALLVAQTNPTTMRETWVWSLVGKIPWRSKWLPTPVFLPGEFHGQRSLAGYSPWGLRVGDYCDFHFLFLWFQRASQGALVVKSPPANAGDIEMWVWSLGQEDPLEKGMATHSSVLVWRISWTEKPGKL